LSYNDVWLTGLPRHDFILRRSEELPADMREQLARLRGLLGDRRLVLFVPTFRHGQGDAYYRFSDDELAWLSHWLEENNALLGVREHMADHVRTYSATLSRIGALDLSDARFPIVEILYREAAVLITDYSSCFIDFMLTGRPALSFAYDHDSYAHDERGLFYELDQVFPGPVCRDFSGLAQALQGIFEPREALEQARYEWKRRMFFDYQDEENAWRVVQKVKDLYVNRLAQGQQSFGEN
jgi:CDP-glycerol glycerophosphotransferase (TagB/SpsB family)